MQAVKELLLLQDTQKAIALMRFFKTGKGEYAENDKFLGINVPQIREVAKNNYLSASFSELDKMLKNEYHEIRLCALIIMVLLYEKTEQKDSVIELYLRNTKGINNWDLVDLSAPKIIGANYIYTKNDKIIRTLSESGKLWEERIAIVSQLSIIKTGEFELLKDLSVKFFNHKHDLIHKATGWMLREAGKKDKDFLISFLNEFSTKMPRTTLRYAIERLSTEEKNFYMNK